MTNYISKINANSTNYTIGGDNFDGQWIIAGGTVLSDVDLSAKTYYYYNLSDFGILPNEQTEDNYAYEVIFAG
ncbi:hypothetical protein U2060_15340, partial [Listeria monocytogenes]|uniref:hypothetical protein n=1 Tax=Listeria monocytogenes TaxID=1639 RepID=UPI002FDC4E5C